MHLRFGIDLINHMREENPELWTDAMKERIKTLIREGVQLEIDYANDVLLDSVEEMDPKTNEAYLKYIGNQRSSAIGLGFIFEHYTTQPFPWMDKMLSMTCSPNFFERINTNYQVGNLSWED